MGATLNVIFGPCGAGKTTYAHAFARREKAVAFVLDDWMARLFGPDMPEPLQYEWMLERVGRCEAQIWAASAAVLAAALSLATGGLAAVAVQAAERFPTLTPEQMTPAQRKVAEAIQAGPRKGLGGPFNTWLRSPELADKLQQVGEHVRFHSSVP